MGAAWQHLPLGLANNLAREQLGAELHLVPEDVELENLRLAVVARMATFEDVRAWVAARLQRR
jgi:hypothetical protein